MKKILSLLLVCLLTTAAQAQRFTDQLDRGLVAMKVTGGVFLSWRITAEEYYGTQYNVYRDGTKLNTEPLSVSNYKDSGGTETSNYTVRAVMGGVEQAASKVATPWASSYREITLTHCLQGSTTRAIKSRLCPNDATCADVDGDGELEILMKFDNIDEVEQSYPKVGPTVDGMVTGEYTIFECLKQDGTMLWWVNCGPNMGDFQNNEQNLMAYDWDQDGKAEAVMRLADGAVIHEADGTTYTVGSTSVNIRDTNGGGVNWFIVAGFGGSKEYLLYMNGSTGKPYEQIDYPLPFLESGETDPTTAWGNKNWAHRASKHFVGAPYLDGHKPSIFLARGIYTRHKMVALDVDPATHKLSVRWRWNCNTDGPWKGQGYHNFGVADVDMDGRDEIVFGSMVIDDNGKGLSTTGFGHGDSQHCSDFDPYRPGLEIYACLEESPNYGNNYRDATTSKVYHHNLGGRDDGRAMCDNFTNQFPGCIGVSNTEGFISTVTGDAVDGLSGDGVNTSMCLYWDGDLCRESYSSNSITKFGSWNAVYTCTGGLTNNGTKNTPCFQGDILGDWREEIIMRTEDNNIRIFSTPTATTYRIPSLWYDHQYRNAMVWQMCGYNQPPHTSFFLGQMEGITMAPPPLTYSGREQVGNGGTVGSSLNGKQVLVNEDNDMSVQIEAGAQPSVLTFNVPSWVQGTAGSESTSKSPKINYTYYTCTVTGDGISGDSRLVKQGDGTLVLPKADFTHTGKTDIWGGTLSFDGTMKKSPLWLNRHTTFISDGGQFQSIKADYGSKILPGGSDNEGSLTTDTLSLGFGSRLVIDLYGATTTADVINVGTLNIERKTGSAWTLAGPEYLMPVIEVIGHLAEGQTKMTPGKYVIANIQKFSGSTSNIILEGIATSKKKLYVEDGKLIVEIIDTRDPSTVVWTGSKNGVWDVGETENWTISGEATSFVAGDKVVFDDNATQKTVTINGNVLPDSVSINASKDYIFSGTGAITGEAVFHKENTGTVTISNDNSYTGGNHLHGGTTKVSLLANQYSDVGNLGGITKKADLFTMENGAVLQATAEIETASPMKMVGNEGGVINSGYDFRMNASLSGTLLTKKGSGVLYTMASNTLSRLVINGGSVAAQKGNPAYTVEFQNGTLYDDAQATTHAIYVPKGKSGTWQLSYTYYTAYSNKLTGEGTLTIIPRNAVQRVRITGDWSKFEGTIKHTTKNMCLPLDMSSGMANGTLDLADGCSVSNTAKAFAIGKLTGKGQLLQPVANWINSGGVSGSNTWNVGNSLETGGDFTFDGTFTDGGGTNKCIFNKVGTCKMTVTGASDHSGATTVSAGELHFNSKATLGKGALTVKNGATLSGITTVSAGLTNSAYTFNNGSTLQVGNTSTAIYGVINFGGTNVTFAKSSILKIGVYRAATNTLTGGCYLKNINRLTFNGTIQLHYSSTFAENIAVGDSIILWKDVTTVSGTPVLESQVIDAERGLYWDTTDLSRGILRVTSTAPTGIRKVTDTSDKLVQSPVEVQFYDLSGRPVTAPRHGQIYIVGGRKIRY